jgi:hypothetical protein
MKRLITVTIFLMAMSPIVYGYTYSDYSWISYNGHQYAFTNTFGTWTDCETEAASLGAHLVTVNNSPEENWLATTFINPESIGKENIEIWIGLYQDHGDPSFSEPAGGWKWISGEPLVYVHWAFPEPTNEAPSEDYGTMQGQNGTYRGGWNDWGPERYDFVPSLGIIEIPEPTALFLLTLGGLLLRKRKP